MHPHPPRAPQQRGVGLIRAGRRPATTLTVVCEFAPADYGQDNPDPATCSAGILLLTYLRQVTSRGYSLLFLQRTGSPFEHGGNDGFV